MIDAATLERLKQQNWDELIPRLYAYTIHLLKRYNVRYRNEVLPKGNEYRDLVHQAITLVFEGKRTWDTEKYPDCFFFIATSVIRGLVWNLYKPANKQGVKEVVLISLSDDNEDENLLESRFADSSNVEGTLHEQEFLQRVEQRIRAHDDPHQLLMKVFKGRLDRLKNQQIAQDLNIDTSDVENAVKRLRRLLKPLIS